MDITLERLIMTLSTTLHGLSLRPVSMDDLENIHHLHSLTETDRYNTMGIPASVAVTRELLTEWIAANNDNPVRRYDFLITDHSGAFVGLIGIKPGRHRSAEIWYKLLPAHWNKGYATDVVKCILHYCFTDLNLHRVEAGCAVDNVASYRVMEKAGMVREGRKRKNLDLRGEWSDGFLYAILEEDMSY